MDEKYQYLYNRVDEALYKAKENGRNCVVLAESKSCKEAMTAIKWNDIWNCGEEEIDRQHKELFQVVSQLMHSSKSTDDKQGTVKHLKDITSAVVAHFDYEEKVLIQVNYEDVYNHKKTHNQLIKRSKEITKSVELGQLNPKKAFDLIFDEVIVGHLLCEDVKFYPYLKN